MMAHSHSRLPPIMWAVVPSGNGGYSELQNRREATPLPGTGEALVQVLVAGINNTEINTRLGCDFSTVTNSTGDLSVCQQEAAEKKADGAAPPFSIIQRANCCGSVVALGVDDKAGAHFPGRWVLARACMRLHGFGSMKNVWMASDFNGAFALYLTVPVS